MDPLFKKASADFDEGGAKGLLLNHLAIDSNGKIVFDSSDDSGDVGVEAETARRKGETEEEGYNAGVRDMDGSDQDASEAPRIGDINLALLGSRFFPDLAKLDEQDVCPSLKSFDLGDPAGSLDIPFLKAPEDWRQESKSPVKGNLGDQTGVFLDGDNVAGFDDDDGIFGGFDAAADARFGEGGDAWVKTAAIEPKMHMQNIGFAEEENGPDTDRDGFGVGDFDPQSKQYAVSLHYKRNEGGHDDILRYFDNALQKNWAGPEHWRIKRIKDTNRAPVPTTSKRKEKEPFEIDFTNPLNSGLAEMIYTPATSNSVITLPKSQWKSKTRNLLPDDKHFNSRQLLRLFLKPKARMGTRRQGLSDRRQKAFHDNAPETEINEAFWAREENAITQEAPEEKLPQGDYDANFFQDDGLNLPDDPPDDDDEFADAREELSTGARDARELNNQGIDSNIANRDGVQEGAFGTQLVTQSRRLRPEYVQYARVAKKVDVRRLKEEMWKGIGFHDVRFLS